MKEENNQSQMRKGILEYCLLTILSKGDGYASDIIQTLKDARLIVVEGTLYPMLMRLKNAGYLTYRWEESKQGPPRKYYSLTDEGTGQLAILHASWQEMVETVNQINNLTLDQK